VPPCRYRVRGCAIVGICDVVGRVVISYAGPRYRTTRRGIVPTRVIVSATRDIVGRDRISPRAPTISRVCAISFAGRDIVPRARYRRSAWQVVRFPTISWAGRGIVPTRVIVSARRDIVRPATLSRPRVAIS
jgi:hypothetical protein